MKKEIKPKRYEIDSFEKLCNVINEENYERLTVDLAGWLRYITLMNKEFREKYPKECEGKTNWEIANCSFVWIDDGKNNLKEVKVTNRETGEIETIELST